MAAKKPRSPKRTNVLSRARKELSKDLLLFTAGALTATIAIANRRKQKRLKQRYKQRIKALKQKKRA
jgi:hypothetical protein